MQTVLDPQASTTGTKRPDAVGGALGTSSSISDLFITLLVAQVKNQNPLEPTDPAAFVGQLTQLSQMEALQKLSDQGTNQAASMASMQLLSLGAQVGSQLTVQTDRAELAGQPLDVGFTLASASSKTTLVLTSAAGIERRIELGTHGVGPVTTTVDPAALGLAAGPYTLRVETSSKENPATHLTGALQSVQLTGNGSAVLQVAGAGQVPASAITGFHGRPATSSN